jgi:hypothetical protein
MNNLEENRKLIDEKNRILSSYKSEIMKAWVFLREKNNTIPSEILDLMKDAAIDSIRNSFLDLPKHPFGANVEELLPGLKLDIIYTFSHKQERIVIPCTKQVFENKKVLSDFVCSMLDKTLKPSLVKISVCVLVDSVNGIDVEDSEWLNECDGKLHYDDKGDLIS